MKIRSGLLTNIYVYETTYSWPEDAAAQCGGGSIDGIGKECFIEVFIKGMSYVRGSGDTLRIAEDKAWAVYQKYKNCEHSFERCGDYSSSGKCTQCGMRKDKQFSYITRCDVCDVLGAAHNVSSTYFCYQHYKEALSKEAEIKKSTGQDLLGEEKYLWSNQVVESMGLYIDRNDEEIRDIFFNLYKGFFEYLIETCRIYHEKFKIGNKIHYVDLHDCFEQNETAFKMAFELFIADNKKVMVNKNMAVNREFIENFIRSYQ